VLLAGAGWRLLDQRAADQSLDLMARSAAAASAGGARAVPSPVPGSGAHVPAPTGPAPGAGTPAAGGALTATPQPLPAQAPTLRPVAAPAALLDGLPEGPAGAAPQGSAMAAGTPTAAKQAQAATAPVAGERHGEGVGLATETGTENGTGAGPDRRADTDLPAGADPGGAVARAAGDPEANASAGALPATAAPFEEFLDEPVQDIAPAPSAPALRGAAALLGTAPPRNAAREPAAARGGAQRTVREPALNDALPDRRTARPGAKSGTVAARDHGPRAFCARQDRYTDYFCMKRQCELPRYRKARECVALRREGWWGFMRGQWRTARQ
jgi:hypothetical protein